MSDVLTLHYKVDGNDFSVAGESSSSVKKVLRELNLDPGTIRRVSIAMYEAEINMVIHADGGTIDVYIAPLEIKIVCQDTGPGIKDVEKALTEGFSTATDKVRELGFGAGMGLPNIKNYTDSLEIDTKVGEGTTLTMIIRV